MKLKYMWFPLIILFLSTTSMSFYQKIYIEPGLPANLRYYNLFSYGIIAVFLAFFIIMTIMLITVKNYPKKYIIGRNIPAGLCAIFAGVCINFYSVFEYLYNKELTNVNLVFNCANSVVGVILIIMAIACFSKKNILREVPLIALAPAVLACFKLGYTTFFTYPNLAEISNQTFKMLSFLFWALFTFSYAKLLSNLQSKNTIKKAIIFGTMCFTVIFVYTMPELVFGFSQMDKSELSRVASYLFLGLFALCITIELIMKTKIDLVHSYNENDFTTFEPEMMNEESSLENQDDFNKAEPQFFDNLIQEGANNLKSIKQDSQKEELDADTLVDDLLNSED